MKKTILKLLIIGLSIFSFAENTFSSSADCDQKADPFCIKSKTISDIKSISGEKKFDSLIISGIEYLLGFLLLISIVYGLYGAWNIFSAMQDDDKVSKGKTIVIRACIGLIVIFLAYPITNFVINNFLFGENDNITNSGNTTNSNQNNLNP